MDIFDVIKKPLLTEKAESLREKNVYLFEIQPRANKKRVKEAIQKIYGFTPAKVNICHRPEKDKRARFRVGKVGRVKKAYVYLNAKDKIQLFEGV